MTFVLCIAIFNADGRSLQFGFKNIATQQDSSVQIIVNKRIGTLTRISTKRSLDTYYINLMEGLYDGVNELLDFESEKGNTNGVMRQAGLFRQFNTERKKYLSAFLKRNPKSTVIDNRFAGAAKAALSNFAKIDFHKYQNRDELITQILIEYYESMDQIDVAFVSFGQNEKLKALSWDIINKQNKIVGLLKERSTG